MPESMKPYLKFWAAVLGATVTTALTIWGPDTPVGQGLVVAAAFFTAVGVFAVENKTEWQVNERIAVKELAEGKGRRFDDPAEAVQWLQSSGEPEHDEAPTTK